MITEIQGYGKITEKLQHLITNYGITEEAFHRLMKFIETREFKNRLTELGEAQRLIEQNVVNGRYYDPRIVQDYYGGEIAA